MPPTLKRLLIYNDYNDELPAKRAKLVQLVQSLRSKNVPIHAIGLQGHYEIDQVPLAEIEATLVEMRKLGVKVVVSELDLDMIPRPMVGRWREISRRTLEAESLSRWLSAGTAAAAGPAICATLRPLPQACRYDRSCHFLEPARRSELAQ